MIKRTAIILIGCLYVMNGFSQKPRLQDAILYYKQGELAKARENIDLACSNEQTKILSKTWYYRGAIFQAIYKNEKFGNLDNNPLPEAYNAYIKSMELDPKNEFSEEIRVNRAIILNLLSVKGVDEFKANKFADALNTFESLISLNSNDTSLFLNAAYAADKSENFEKAKKYYRKLIDMKYKNEQIYSYLANIYKFEKDTVQALSVIQMGRKAYPSNNNLVIEELNIYLSSGRSQEAAAKLEEATKLNPGNQELFFALGTAYDKMGEILKAEMAYKKAIEIKPDYFDAYYNLGAMYFNQGAEMSNKANSIENNDEYKKAKAKADEKLKEASPYLEKARALNGKDRNTLLSLKQLYLRINDTEKFNQVNTDLNNLK
jgi:tetratricopeptide (TPR) repeat protein